MTKLTRLILSTLMLFLLAISAIAEESTEVDNLIENVKSNLEQNIKYTIIEHSKLAEKSGENLSPSSVLIFSDPKVNTAILQVDPLSGLDLPFRILFYENAEGETVVTATTADFIEKRHHLSDTAPLAEYTNKLKAALARIEKSRMRPLDTTSMTKGYGVKQYQSAYDFETTLARFKEEVLGNNTDTLWFGEFDFTGDAAQLRVTLPRMMLLMFGAPAPGAKAMNGFKTLGLDAFCQKVLLIEQNGIVSLYSNDIVDMARLHYDDNNLTHRVINFRLNRAYSSVVEK